VSNPADREPLTARMWRKRPPVSPWLLGASSAASAPPPESSEWREAEQQLSEAYLRLRKKLRDFGAFDTPSAPSGPDVWATTERALDKALARGGAPPEPSDAAIQEAGTILWGGLPNFDRRGGIIDGLRQALRAAYRVDHVAAPPQPAGPCASFSASETHDECKHCGWTERGHAEAHVIAAALNQGAPPPAREVEGPRNG
jgi:hypothetical protein